MTSQNDIGKHRARQQVISAVVSWSTSKIIEHICRRHPSRPLALSEPKSFRSAVPPPPSNWRSFTLRPKAKAYEENPISYACRSALHWGPRFWESMCLWHIQQQISPPYWGVSWRTWKPGSELVTKRNCTPPLITFRVRFQISAQTSDRIQTTQSRDATKLNESAQARDAVQCGVWAHAHCIIRNIQCDQLHDSSNALGRDGLWSHCFFSRFTFAISKV